MSFARNLYAALLVAPLLGQGGSISIATPSLPNGYLGTTYGYASGEFPGAPRLLSNVPVPGAAWSAEGSFPPGLTLAGTGEITGVPTREGVYTFTVVLRGAFGSVSRALSITISPALPLATVPVQQGAAFRYKPVCPISSTISSYASLTAPPSGVSFNPSTGEFSGTFATRTGYRTLWTCRSNQLTFTGDLNFVVLAQGRRFVPPAFTGVPYQLLLDIRYGVAPVQASLVSGSLPPGLSLNPATRLISGVPSSAGTFRFQVRYTDAAGNFAAEQLEIVVSRATLGVSPQSLTFSGNAGGAITAPQALSLSGGVGQSYTITSSARWLLALPAAGLLPETITVRADPSTLAQGTHSASLIVTSPTVPPVTIQATFEVGPALAPELTAEPSRLLFNFARGERGATRLVTIRNQGGGTVPIAMSIPPEAREWFSIAPSEGTVSPAVPFAFRVIVLPGNLPPGLYQTQIRISVANARSFTIPVFVTIERNDRLTLSDEGLFFRSKGPRVFPDSDQILVIPKGVNPVNWTARVQATTSQQWIRIRPTSGTSTPGQRPPAIEVSADPTGLPPGLYFARLEVRTAAGDVPSDFATIALRVLPPGGQQTPIGDRSGILFIAGKDTEEAIRIFNPTDSPLTVSSVANLGAGQNWLSLDGAGTIAPGDSQTLTVQADPEGLKAGIYSGELIFSFGDGGGVLRAGVAFIVPRASAAASVRTAAGCAPTELKAIFTRLGSDFSSPVGLPIPVAVTVADDCGELMSDGSVSLTFSNGDPALPLKPAGDGKWTGTWVPRGSVSRVTVTAEATSVATPPLTSTIQLSGGVESNSSTPVINGVTSSVSFSNSDPLAPGAFLSVFGSGLADGLSIADTLPRPTELSGTRVFLNGKEVPLLFVSDKQVNGLIPFDTPSDTTYQVFVMRNGALSGNERVPVAAAQPAVFSKAGDGKGQGLILAITPDSYNIAEPATPARPGQSLVIFCTGLGLTDQTVDAASVAPSDPLARTKADVTVTVGGLPAPLSFAGLSPGYTSLFQVNTQVPADVAGGDEVPVVVTANGRSSPVITIAVRR